MTTFVALADSKSGSDFAGPTCGLSSAGAILCWGPSPSGEVGLSGRDLCASAITSLSVACSRSPESVSGTLKFATVDVGGNAAAGPSAARICGVTEDGEAYCWGENAQGAIGDSTRVNRTAPTRVVLAEKWIDISTGTRQSCGVTVRGVLYCWGDNTLGGLGTGDVTSSIVPRQVQSYRALRLGRRGRRERLRDHPCGRGALLGARGAQWRRRPTGASEQRAG